MTTKRRKTTTAKAKSPKRRVSLQTWLKRRDACAEALEWVGTKTYKTAWETCPNALWLVWFLIRLGIAEPEKPHISPLNRCWCSDPARYRALVKRPRIPGVR